MDKSSVAPTIGALVGTQSTAAQVMARYRATAKSMDGSLVNRSIL